MGVVAPKIDTCKLPFIVFFSRLLKNGKYSVFAKGGREDTGMDAIEWAINGEKNGAGELVINSIDTDGVKNGFDTSNS